MFTSLACDTIHCTSNSYFFERFFSGAIKTLMSSLCLLAGTKQSIVLLLIVMKGGILTQWFIENMIYRKYDSANSAHNYTSALKKFEFSTCRDHS